MRPPRPGAERRREKGVRRQQMNFKPDPDLREYVKAESKTQGWTETLVLNDMVRTQKELEETLGDLWFEIEADAIRQQLGKGRVLADLVAQALKKRTRGR